MRREIEDLIQNCPECIKNQRMTHNPLVTTTLPEGPWQEIATDLFEFEGRNYALFIDYYSRWIEVVELRNQTGLEVVRKFRTIIARFGAPIEIRSDNGPCYISKEWNDLMSQFNIKHVTSSPHHHEANGLAERGIQTVKNMWRKEEDKNLALMAYRTTPLESLKRPDELMLGRKTRTELPFRNGGEAGEADFHQRDEHLKGRQKRNFDKTHRAKEDNTLKAGDRVWIKINNEDKGKEGIIKYEAEERDSYWVETDKRLVRRTRRHLRSLPQERTTTSHSEDRSTNPSQPVERTTQGQQAEEGIGRNRGKRMTKRPVDPDFLYY